MFDAQKMTVVRVSLVVITRFAQAPIANVTTIRNAPSAPRHPAETRLLARERAERTRLIARYDQVRIVRMLRMIEPTRYAHSDGVISRLLRSVRVNE